MPMPSGGFQSAEDDDDDNVTCSLPSIEWVFI